MDISDSYSFKSKYLGQIIFRSTVYEYPGKYLLFGLNHALLTKINTTDHVIVKTSIEVKGYGTNPILQTKRRWAADSMCLLVNATRKQIW
ncbi:Hypothetical predicted protein [Mytilus galloprovincialis]|uniref:Uncharacterized protein n=1 Tax=Mytilus galloprovincialis TaxID=29158 RepID=A0A8B6GK55_MYTGA|nr:Hypothetical predicted protein [Mytilus galloprovincialis]